MDTIFALATAQGKAGVAVIRVSGPQAEAVALELSGPLVRTRQAVLRRIVDAQGGEIDQALVIRFEAPNSFTGEDVVEFHLHGSVAVVSACLDRLAAFPGVRLAEPGEFTRRALENGKLDLVQVEGLADLIDAETEAQRLQAQRSLAGDLGRLADRWRQNLIRAAALIEATIDFADEDVPVDVTPEVSDLLDRVSADIRQQIAGVSIAERLRNGFEVAIVGAPNVGKSTLLNALAGRDAAITSHVAGTTRDVIEVRMDLRGLPVTLLDTAGLRSTEDVVETIGIERARNRANTADLRVFLTEDIGDLGVAPRADDIVVRPKADLHEEKAGAVSGLTGEGIDALVERIANVLARRTQSAGLATRTRHRDAMAAADAALDRAGALLQSGPDRYDLAAEEMRSAIRPLESLVGRIDVENLLDEIFASFCLGK